MGIKAEQLGLEMPALLATPEGGSTQKSVWTWE